MIVMMIAHNSVTFHADIPARTIFPCHAEQAVRFSLVRFSFLFRFLHFLTFKSQMVGFKPHGGRGDGGRAMTQRQYSLFLGALSVIYCIFFLSLAIIPPRPLSRTLVLLLLMMMLLVSMMCVFHLNVFLALLLLVVT